MYPNIFINNCAKDISCNTNLNNSCKNGLNNINNEMKKLKKTKTAQEKMDIKKGNIDKEKGLICQEYSSPYDISNNNINFNLLSNHSWSNQRGYGNIQVSSFDDCNNLKGKIFNWNRIPKQYNPYSSPANVNMAWSKNS